MKGFFAFPAKQPGPYSNCDGDMGLFQCSESAAKTTQKPTIFQTPTPFASAEWPYADVCYLLDSVKGA